MEGRFMPFFSGLFDSNFLGYLTFLLQMEHSTGYVLFMYDAKFTNSGPYTCEVIVDTTFDTLMFTKKLLVIGKKDY